MKRFGLAVGSAGALLYAGCVLVMLCLPEPTVVAFFNSLLHGLDVGPIVRTDMPWGEALMGLVQTFILAWITGAVVAVVYNISLPRRS